MILPGPPKDWKRPTMTVRVKVQVVINQAGRCKATGEGLGLAEHVQFDHRPALWERQFDTTTNDTIPPSNDAGHIEAITTAAHDKRTHGPGGEMRITTRGSDSGNRAKDRAVAMNTAVHVAVMAAKAAGTAPAVSNKPKQKIAGRPLQGGRKFPSRKPA